MKWTKRQSGNRRGRPKVTGTVREIRELARAHTLEAVKTLAGIMKNSASPPASRVAAACALLDRGWGRPTQHVEAQVDDLRRLSDRELDDRIRETAAAAGLVVRPAEEEDEEIAAAGAETIQ